jgi:hypothetical protein
MAIGFLYSDTGRAGKNAAKQGTTTVKCVKDSPFEIPGGFTNVPTPVSTSDFDSKCNAKFTDCQGSCAASTDTEEALKKKYLKSTKDLKQKPKYFDYKKELNLHKSSRTF